MCLSSLCVIYYVKCTVYNVDKIDAERNLARWTNFLHLIYLLLFDTLLLYNDAFPLSSIYNLRNSLIVMLKTSAIVFQKAVLMHVDHGFCDEIMPRS
jgi:hypothetical protein